MKFKIGDQVEIRRGTVHVYGHIRCIAKTGHLLVEVGQDSGVQYPCHVSDIVVEENHNDEPQNGKETP